MNIYSFHIITKRLVLLPTVCFFITLALMFSSCKYFKKPKPQKENPIARVGNHYLYADDLKYLFQSKEKIADSAAIVKTFIDDWVRKKLLLETAMKYLPRERQQLEKEIQDYRESLLIYQYEDELVKQKLDTSITEAAIDSFYNNYKQNFLLEYDLAQLNYIKIPLDAPKIDSARYLMTYSSKKNHERLINYCYQYSGDFYLKDSMWLSVETIVRKFPTEHNYIKSLSKSGATGEVTDSSYLYLLKVKDYKSKGEVAPLNQIRNDLRFMLINKRKQQLLTDAYDNIYLDAIKEGEFEVFAK